MTRVSIEISDHIAHVTLTRPEKINAVDPEMIRAVISAAQSLDRADVRCVVLSGAGKGFCAGLDVASFAALAGGNPKDMVLPRTHGDTNDYQEFAMAWRRLPVPVIAALHGPVFGAGFQLSLGADIRIAAPDAQFAIMEMKWGLIPDMGGMVLLPQLTRSDVIRRMTYTAEILNADRMERWGLVTEISENPLQSALNMAGVIASKSPMAIRAAKRLIDACEAQDRQAVLLRESVEQADLIGTSEQMEVIAANLQKRTPVFD